MPENSSVASGKVSFEKFCSIYRECKPGLQDADFQRRYNKLGGLSEEQIREFLCSQTSDGSEFVPRVKSNRYLANVKQQIRTANVAEESLPHVTLQGTDLSILLFERTATIKDPRGGFLHKEALSLPIGAKTFDKELFFRRLADGLRMALDNLPVLFQRDPVYCFVEPACSVVLARLMLPTFVAFLREQVGCTESDALIVVPFSKQRLYAVRSSDSTQCSSLGGIVSPAQAAADPDFITSTPFEVFASAPVGHDGELSEIQKGKQLVTLTPYLNRGGEGNPKVKYVGSDGRVRCYVPECPAELFNFTSWLRAGNELSTEPKDYPPSSTTPPATKERLGRTAALIHRINQATALRSQPAAVKAPSSKPTGVSSANTAGTPPTAATSHVCARSAQIGSTPRVDQASAGLTTAEPSHSVSGSLPSLSPSASPTSPRRFWLSKDAGEDDGSSGLLPSVAGVMGHVQSASLVFATGQVGLRC